MKIIKFPPGRIDKFYSARRFPGFPRCLIMFVTSIHLIRCRCYAGELATCAPCCSLASCSSILDHCWSKTLSLLSHAHIEQPPRGHRGPGCLTKVGRFSLVPKRSLWSPHWIPAQDPCCTAPRINLTFRRIVGDWRRGEPRHVQKRMALRVLRCGSAWCDFGFETPVIPFCFGGFKMF